MLCSLLSVEGAREKLDVLRVQAAVDEQLLAIMPEARINPWPCLSR